MGSNNPWSSQRKAARKNKQRMQDAYEKEYIHPEEEFRGSEKYKQKKSK